MPKEGPTVAERRIRLRETLVTCHYILERQHKEEELNLLCVGLEG